MSAKKVEVWEPEDWGVKGELVAIPVKGPGKREWRLDGFFRGASGKGGDGLPLLVFVHGMGSNFYRSKLKKAFLEVAPRRGLPVLSVNNSGADGGTFDERFSDCLYDLDAIRDWAARRGMGRVVWVGHSTGCQKSVFWQARRRAAETAGIVLLAPADDNAILKRDWGALFARKVAWARRQVAEGKGDVAVERGYERFSARRFLSVAEESRAEAGVFRYAGRLTAFRKVKCPVLAVFGAEEEFAVLPPKEMLEKLAKVTKSEAYTGMVVPGTGHSFREAETEVAETVCAWVRDAVAGAAR